MVKHGWFLIHCYLLFEYLRGRFSFMTMRLSRLNQRIYVVYMMMRELILYALVERSDVATYRFPIQGVHLSRPDHIGLFWRSFDNSDLPAQGT